ncbi:MAG: hypothetical protein ACKVZ0_01400 [Gemmatimonadales bacterium]
MTVRRWFIALVLLTACLGGRSAMAQARVKGAEFIRVPDTAAVQILKLTDGSTLVGRFTDVSGDPLQFQTESGVIQVRRATLVEVRELLRGLVKNGKVWRADPNPTRLYFGPTARSLPKGQADFSNTYLFLLSGGVGLGGNVQVGGGFSVLPLDDFSDNIFFLTAKVGFRPAKNVNLAVGGLLGRVGGFGSDLGGEDGEGVGALYGVGTFGTDDHSLTTALIFPYASGDLGDEPVAMVGGEIRLARSIKFVTENYFTTGGNDDFAGIFSYGVRLFGEKISVSLAFWNSTEEQIFPGLPYVDFVIRF